MEPSLLLTDSGWPDGFAFVLSFLAPLWTICTFINHRSQRAAPHFPFSIMVAAGFDSSLHISEEAENARVAVPRGLVGATVVAGVMGWGKSLVTRV